MTQNPDKHGLMAEMNDRTREVFRRVVDSYLQTGANIAPEIRVALRADGPFARITVADNGIGLPEDRARLFEPYVTTRDEGTGLGLPIVKKIIEDHGGALSLQDAPSFDGTDHVGAMAVIRLPLGTGATAPQYKAQQIEEAT